MSSWLRSKWPSLIHQFAFVLSLINQYHGLNGVIELLEKEKRKQTCCSLDNFMFYVHWWKKWTWRTFFLKSNERRKTFENCLCYSEMIFIGRFESVLFMIDYLSRVKRLSFFLLSFVNKFLSSSIKKNPNYFLSIYSNYHFKRYEHQVK